MSAFSLKLIAVLTMIIDHFGMIFVPHNLILRIIGRLAFPIFCFLLVEGYFNTSDVKKYFGRLITFAFISEVPFDLARTLSFPDDSHNNVFFTLAIGLLAIMGTDYFRKQGRFLLAMFPIAACCFFAEMLHTDYSARGVLIIICFYMLHEFDEFIVKIFAIIAFIVLNTGFIQYYAVLALIPIYFYNGKRGKNIKYFFYAIYPLHLLLFALANYWGNAGFLLKVFAF